MAFTLSENQREARLARLENAVQMYAAHASNPAERDGGVPGINVILAEEVMVRRRKAAELQTKVLQLAAERLAVLRELEAERNKSRWQRFLSVFR